MWNQFKEECEVKIPPNVLKNFNVFDILEPQKNGATTSEEPNVDKLIDINDSSCDSGFSEVNASFLDKKKNYDIIDVFQNIFVTPQLITKKDSEHNEATNSSSSSNSKTFEVNEDFTRFLDDLESGKKIDWTNISEKKREADCKRYLDELAEKPKVLVPKLPNNTRKTCSESDSDPEELILDVLMQKKFEEYILKKCSPSKTVNDVDRQQESSAKTVTVNPVNDGNRVANNHSKNNVNDIKNLEVPFEYLQQNLNNNTCNTTEKQSDKLPSNAKTTPIDSQISNSLYHFKLIPMKKDDKIYKKSRLVKPESQTSKYTKGPDFYEKSVVLPQIMARMTARQAYLDEKDNQKRRLVLDGGIKTSMTDRDFSNTSNEHKSKVKTSSTIQSTSKADSRFPPTLVKTESSLPSTACMTSKPSPSTLLKPERVIITKDTRLCMNRETQNIAIHDAEKQCSNCNKKPKTSTSVKTSDDYGKLSPIVLMEDCNKERLKDLMLSQKFKNFAQNGKL